MVKFTARGVVMASIRMRMEASCAKCAMGRYSVGGTEQDKEEVCVPCASGNTLALIKLGSSLKQFVCHARQGNILNPGRANSIAAFAYRVQSANTQNQEWVRLAVECASIAAPENSQQAHFQVALLSPSVVHAQPESTPTRVAAKSKRMFASLVQ